MARQIHRWCWASLLVLSALAPASGQHFFQVMTSSGAGTESVNGEYVENDAMNHPGGFVKKILREEKDESVMWKRHSGHFRVWFSNDHGVYVYHDAVDSKWYIEDSEGKRLYQHQDTHHQNDGHKFSNDPAHFEEELPPKSGYEAVEGKEPGPSFSYRHIHDPVPPKSEL